jgi:hypothetical protein
MKPAFHKAFSSSGYLGLLKYAIERIFISALDRFAKLQVLYRSLALCRVHSQAKDHFPEFFVLVKIVLANYPMGYILRNLILLR